MIQLEGLVSGSGDSLRFFLLDRPFRPFPVSDSSRLLMQRLEALHSETASSTAPWNITLQGFWQRTASEGSAAPDSVLVIRSVTAFTREPEFFHRGPYEFSAMGPNWTLQVDASSRTLRFDDLRSDETYFFEYFSPTASGEVWVYESNNFASQMAVRATFYPEPCTSVGTTYPYRAVVVLNGRTYTGCAIRGRPEE
ncbi:MAG: hypothetical protein NZM08_02180 [Chitinophagales bacterium]|nr:hypothetical protein [Chitinophagales bacterium]